MVLMTMGVLLPLPLVSLPLGFALSALTLLVGRQKEHLACKKFEWRGTDVVICLDRAANDLHTAQLMPLPPHRLLLN